MASDDQDIHETASEEPEISVDSDNSTVEEERVDVKKSKKRSPLLRFFKGLFLTILFLILAILIFLGVFLGVSFIDRRNPTDALPPGFDAYVRVESAGELLLTTMDLEVADIMLASPNMASIRGALVGLREQDLVRGKLFSFLADIRVDAALYGDDFLLIGDLRARSLVTRIASPFFRYSDRLRIRELEYREENGIRYFIFAGGDSPLFFAVGKNLFLASSNRDVLFQSYNGVDFRDRDADLDAVLSRKSEGDLRVLVNPQSFTAGMLENNENLGRLLALMDFSRHAVVDLSVTNETIAVNAVIPVSSSNPGLEALIQNRSAAPAIVNLLPEKTAYASIVSAGTPEELANVFIPLAGPDFSEALEKADKAANAALKMDLDELIFSWTGQEMGLFGLDDHPEPVFFIRVKDERRRKSVFQDVLDSFLVSGDDDIVIEDVRLTHISFPWYIRGVLEALDVQLPEPYFAVSDDFLFLSVSAEAVARTVSSIEKNELLINTEDWEKSGGRVPASAALEVVYSLDRSIPFFLQGQGTAADALRLYRQGVASLRFDGGELKISLAAAASGGSGVSVMPGFPVKTEGRLRSAVETLTISDGGDRLYWLEGDDTLVEYDASTGKRTTAGLDDESRLAVGEDFVWAISRRGNIYSFGPNLKARTGFPVATPYVASADPIVVDDFLVIPEREEKTLFLIGPEGERSNIPVVFDDPLAAPPAHRAGLWAAYPKGFLAALHLFDDEGIASEGWPVPVDEIAYGSPIFVDDGESFLVAFLTQAGELTFYDPNGVPVLNVGLDGVFYSNPVWASSSGALYAFAEEGIIYKVAVDGDVDRIDLEGVKAKEGVLSLCNVVGDEKEEVFLSGTGAVVYGFTSDLFPLEGFPLSGGRRPAFADLNSDGGIDLISGGYDNTVRAYSFR